EIVARYVTDFGSRQMLDAASAFYVVGSSAQGPMRAGNLPAFASEQAARAFAEQRGGEVRAFAEIDAALVQRLGGRAAHRH
ncbi:MAG: nitrous oxide reductase accessory protein NosL, partial [Giesbergeria sp.]|nr:nitrous oxide reductase accessory protein NosL [Giesbergeria sp.]